MVCVFLLIGVFAIADKVKVVKLKQALLNETTFIDYTMVKISKKWFIGKNQQILKNRNFVFLPFGRVL